MKTTQFPSARGPMATMIQQLTEEARAVPGQDRLAPRPTKTGTLDLTASTLFVTAVDLHARIAHYARTLDHFVSFRSAKINFGAALEMLLRTLHALHALWRQKSNLTPDDLEIPGFDRFATTCN